MHADRVAQKANRFDIGNTVASTGATNSRLTGGEVAPRIPRPYGGANLVVAQRSPQLGPVSRASSAQYRRVARGPPPGTSVPCRRRPGHRLAHQIRLDMDGQLTEERDVEDSQMSRGAPGTPVPGVCALVDCFVVGSVQP